MKTTIKLTTSKKLVVTPCKRGGVIVELIHGEPFSPQSSEALHLTPDQAGAFMFGMEQAMESLEVSKGLAAA